MTDQPGSGAGDGDRGKSALELVVGKSTDKYYKWQQIPAWVLGGAAILGGAALIAFPKSQSRDAWAAVIVGAFLAVVLSYRSAFTLNDDAGEAGHRPGTRPSDSPTRLSEGDTATQPSRSDAPTQPKAGAGETGSSSLLGGARSSADDA